MSKAAWKTFTDPRFPLRFKYPDTTPQGYAVNIKETVVGENIRLHFTSGDSKEVYFEVSRLAGISVQDSYEKLREEIEARFNGSVSSLEPATFAGQAAFEMSFEWGENRRLVSFVPRDEVINRILCNPASELNMQIRSTVEFL